MKFYLTLILFVAMQSISAQIIKPKEVAKRKATVRTNNAIDRSIDKGLDKVEEGIGNIFKKKISQKRSLILRNRKKMIRRKMRMLRLLMVQNLMKRKR